MNEIKSVQLRIKSFMPGRSIEAFESFEDAIWLLVDIYGIPETCNKVLSFIDELLDGLMSDEK